MSSRTVCTSGAWHAALSKTSACSFPARLFALFSLRIDLLQKDLTRIPELSDKHADAVVQVQSLEEALKTMKLEKERVKVWALEPSSS